MTTHAVAVEMKRRTCLVVAPPAADLSTVRRLLRDREVESLILAEVPPIGVAVLDQLSGALVHAGLNSLAAGSAPQCLYAAMRPQSQARANRQAICAKLY